VSPKGIYAYINRPVAVSSGCKFDTLTPHETTRYAEKRLVNATAVVAPYIGEAGLVMVAEKFVIGVDWTEVFIAAKLAEWVRSIMDTIGFGKKIRPPEVIVVPGGGPTTVV